MTMDGESRTDAHLAHDAWLPERYTLHRGAGGCMGVHVRSGQVGLCGPPYPLSSPMERKRGVPHPALSPKETHNDDTVFHVDGSDNKSTIKKTQPRSIIDHRSCSLTGA